MANDSDPNVGVGTPITPSTPGPTSPEDISNIVCEAIPLWRYAAKIKYPEDQFFNVRNEATYNNYACRDLWQEEQRQSVRDYLIEAQIEVEDELGFFLCPQWVYPRMQDVPNGSERHIDSANYERPLITRWGMVLQGGTMATSAIATGAVVNHGADPAVIGPIATTVTDADEIRVFHPGSAREISPSRIVISGGGVTIYIPRSRMVLEALIPDPAFKDYDILANFESTIDIYRVYNDPSVNAVLVTPHVCDVSCTSTGCAEYTQNACIYVRKQRIGSIFVERANYSAGTWTRNNLACYDPSLVRLYYQAGLQYLDRQLEDAVFRLAHTKMPEPPCGCDFAEEIWKRDREIPAALTETMAENPFGPSNGARIAWNFVRARKLGQMSVI